MAERFDVTGIAEMQQRLQAFAAEVTPLLAIALQQEADAILEVSQGLVPVDTGLLRSTGAVSSPTLAGLVAAVEISYGGQGTAPYAAKVHFDTTMRHPRGGQAFYLQQPFFEATNGMLERLADAIRVAL